MKKQVRCLKHSITEANRREQGKFNSWQSRLREKRKFKGKIKWIVEERSMQAKEATKAFDVCF